MKLPPGPGPKSNAPKTEPGHALCFPVNFQSQQIPNIFLLENDPDSRVANAARRLLFVLVENWLSLMTAESKRTLRKTNRTTRERNAKGDQLSCVTVDWQRSLNRKLTLGVER